MQLFQHVIFLQVDGLGLTRQSVVDFYNAAFANLLDDPVVAQLDAHGRFR